MTKANMQIRKVKSMQELRKGQLHNQNQIQKHKTDKSSWEKNIQAKQDDDTQGMIVHILEFQHCIGIIIVCCYALLRLESSVIYPRGKSLLELWVTTFLPDWQLATLNLCQIYLKLLVRVLYYCG